MSVPEVNRKLLEELEGMGFPLALAARALHYSGNSSLVDVINWIFDHDNDPDMDQMPLVPVEINLEDPKPFGIPEEVKIKADKLRNQAHKSRGEEEKELERERIRASKELLEAKQIAEENERKCMIALREADNEEERRAREKICQKLEADKAERRSRLGLPAGGPAPMLSKPGMHVVPQSSSVPVVSTKCSELLRNCFRTLRHSNKDDDAKVKRAFQTLQINVRNVMKDPDDEKFRKIRLTNPVFQDRVGSPKGGIRFLELCGFERVNGSQCLYLPRNKVDMAVLASALSALDFAMTNPFFGLLSVDLSGK